MAGIESMFGQAGRDGASTGHYDGGGILGGIGKAGSWLAGKAKDLVKGSLLKSPAADQHDSRQPFADSRTGDIADAVRGLPTKALDSILAWIKPKDKAEIGNWNGTIAPGVIGKMQQWALAQAARPTFGLLSVRRITTAPAWSEIFGP
jgi:hypothetical protein